MEAQWEHSRLWLEGKQFFNRSGDQGNEWHKSSVEIFDPRASTVRKGTLIVQQPPFNRKSIHWYKACERAIRGAVVTEANICADGWSDVHRISWNTHFFSVSFLVKKLHYTLFPSGQLHNCVQAAHFCDPPHIKWSLQVIIIPSKCFQFLNLDAIPVILRLFQMTFDQGFSFRILC